VNRHSGQLRLVHPVTSGAFTCRLTEEGDSCIFHLDGEHEGSPPHTLALQIEATRIGEGLCRTESGRILPFAWAWVGPQLHLWLDGDLFVFQREDGRRRDRSPGAEFSGDVLAPMPGAVLDVLVSEGERVERNQTVLLMESMKMELAITAPGNAVVRRVAVQPGQQVERGMRMLELTPAEDSETP